MKIRLGESGEGDVEGRNDDEPRIKLRLGKKLDGDRRRLGKEGIKSDEMLFDLEKVGPKRHLLDSCWNSHFCHNAIYLYFTENIIAFFLQLTLQYNFLNEYLGGNFDSVVVTKFDHKWFILPCIYTTILFGPVCINQQL